MNKCQCLVLLSSWKVCIFQIPSSPAQRRATLTEVEVLKPNSRNSNGKISGYYDLSCRLSLDQCEAEVSELESRVEKVMKLCSRMVEAGQAYNAANQLFLTGLMDFSAYHRKDRGIMNCLHQFSEGLQEMIHFHAMLLDQTQRAINQQFLPQLKDSRREFLRIGEDLEAVVVKNAQVSRHKIVDAEQASHLLLATRKCYQHFGLDYCLQVIALWEFDWVFSAQEEFQSLFDDLRLCAVKSVDNTERRFCFEIVSVQKSCSLQADSEELREAWVTAVQGSIDMAYRQRVESQQLMVSSPPLVPRTPVTPSALGVALQGSGNQHCCDCGAEEPRWASLNLGITMCIECSGIHRSLGVHLSKVRSLTLDSWDPEQLKLLCVLGNDVINTIYEAQVSEKGRLKPSPDSQRQEKQTWIREKYVEKKFVKEAITTCLGTGLVFLTTAEYFSLCMLFITSYKTNFQTPVLKFLLHLVKNHLACHQYFSVYLFFALINFTVPAGDGDSQGAQEERERVGRRLYQAAQQGDLVSMATALAQGAEVNWSNAEDEGRTPLIAATCGGSLLACHFLLQNGANVNQRDQRGQGALHAAATRGHTGQVCLLLKRGANQYSADERGQDPLSIAVETAHADIVTLLRMARMNEEMKDSDGLCGNIGDDETFQDIFRDFSNMASHDPERLSRRQFSREQRDGGSEDLC
uniref:Arf-GAP with coiled-coil, ANK repeat and PH domain-containing protein n=1 Tax=Scleropages formosus TaxID=113540 RepID=A0A8C9U1B6_SCLFO